MPFAQETSRGGLHELVQRACVCIPSQNKGPSIVLAYAIHR
ncbi:hypothetical protein pah_c022o230 [Parachlamydia acanthamoebae str. Hall's coccus]|nr:hypothetical protein pah_c022o230 [Parachlamydia acanthamoebae str. Hall's coccus]